MMMSSSKSRSGKAGNSYEEDGSITYELRRGPWTLEEDNLLIHYVTCHGEGRWNSLAKLAGLRRTGKSCRLRWLNYLKPDVKRGNLTPHEQLLILELHSKWGNRWSKIAQHLPGRTDNEIKNYWRTRVQKQARQLKIDSNSKKFLEAIRMFWMPRLLEKIEQDSPELKSSPSPSSISDLESSKNFTENPTPAFKYPSSSNIANDDLDGKSSSVKTHGMAGLLTPTGGSSLHENDFYQPSSSDDDKKLELESQIIPFSSCHVEEFDDWFNDDLGITFWNTGEIWQ